MKMKCAGYTVTVTRVAQLVDENGRIDSDGQGMVNLNTLEIQVIKGLSVDRENEVIIHELKHLVHSMLGVDLGEKEEPYVQGASPLWHGLLIQNRRQWERMLAGGRILG